MNVFSYKLRCDYYEKNEHQSYIATGLGLAEDYIEAMKQLDETYGNEITEVLSLYLMDTAHVIALPETVVEDYKSKEFPDIEYQQSIEENKNA